MPLYYVSMCKAHDDGHFLGCCYVNAGTYEAACQVAVELLFHATGFDSCVDTKGCAVPAGMGPNGPGTGIPAGDINRFLTLDDLRAVSPVVHVVTDGDGNVTETFEA